MYTIRIATTEDIPAITDLANRYILNNLSAEDRLGGFLTGQFEVNAMQKMVASATSVVALYQQEITGFVINSDLAPKDYPPLLQTMTNNFPAIFYRGLPLTAYNFFFYGPVMVSKLHRGKGLLSRMFRQTKTVLHKRYNLGVAFIHENNRVSLNIHATYLGMEKVGAFTFAGEKYYTLVFELGDDINPETGN